MPLIRIISDGENNSEHRDKMIFIDGIPEEWMFEKRTGQDEKGRDDTRLFLKEPWELDITDNIPEGIRNKFQPEPMKVWFETPQEIMPGTYQAPTERNWIRWIREGYGLRINLQHNSGRKMWDQIVGLLDRETPRNERIPQAAIVGDKFQWTLQPSQVPTVRLTGTRTEVPKEQVQIIEPKPVPRPNQYPCRTCGDVFDKERGRWMHERKKHGVKEAFLSRKVAVA